MNVLANLVVIFIMLFISFAFFVSASLIEQLATPIQDALVSKGLITENSPAYGQSLVFVGMVKEGFKIAIWFIIAYSLFSSFVANQTYWGWLMVSIMSVFLAAALVYFGALMWNSMITYASGNFNFVTGLSEGLLVIPKNFWGIMSANVVAGLLSAAYHRVRSSNVNFQESYY